jgi:hypothetical protein
VREGNPAAYFKGMLSLLPKDMSLRDTNRANTLESFPATQALIERVIREREAEVAVLDKKSPEIVR